MPKVNAFDAIFLILLCILSGHIEGSSNTAVDTLYRNNLLLSCALVPQASGCSDMVDLLVERRPDWGFQAWTDLLTRHWQRGRGLYTEVLCHRQEVLPGLLCPDPPSALATERSYSIEICGPFGIVESVSPNNLTIFKCYSSHADCQWYVRPSFGFVCLT